MDIFQDIFQDKYKDKLREIQIYTVKNFQVLNSCCSNFKIGRIITENQEKYGWGKSIVEKLSDDLNLIFEGWNLILIYRYFY